VYRYISRLGLYSPSLVEGLHAEPSDVIDADRTDDGPPTFDGRHGMRTQAMLRAADRMVAGKTEVWGDDCAWGVAGRVWVLLATRSGRAVAGVSPTRRAPGRPFARCAARTSVAYPLVPGVRPSFWTARVPDAITERMLADVTRLEIVHSTGPADRIDEVIDRGIRDGKAVEEIADSVAALPHA
jgi:hypothetical protein